MLKELSIIEQSLNIDLETKVLKAIALHHEEYIGTPPKPTIEQRLWLAERCNPIWWVAASFLWVRDLWRGYWRTRQEDQEEDADAA